MTTIVTAFYPMKNKYGSGEIYKSWSQTFLENIEAPFVIFTSAEFAPLFASYRQNFPTKIIVKDFYSFELTSPQMMQYWEYQSTKDEEKRHSAELYAVWAMKQEFVSLAIRENPFRSTHFVWSDIGIVREPDVIPLIKNFPQVIPFKNEPGKIMILGIGDCRGGGILAGNIEAWTNFTRLYKETLHKMERDGLFTGKDQTVYKNMEESQPNLFQVIQAEHWFPTKNIHIFDSIWFYLLRYLSSV